MANEIKRSKRIIIDYELDKKINPENLKFFDKYVRDMEIRELSQGTIEGYTSDIMQWFRYLVKEQYNPCVIDLTEDDILEFIYFCKKEGNNTERIKRRMASISAFYKFLRKKKIIKENPMEFVDRPKKGLPVVVQTFLTPEQYEDLKKKLEEYGDLQLQTYVLFSISTMARVTAISNVKWEQIDFENRTVDDVLEKEGYIVTLYFSEEVCELLKRLRQYRKENDIDDQGFVFISRNGTQASSDTLFQWTKKVGEMINIPTLHPHDYRHSGSQLLKLAGMPIEDISELLNHKGLDVTKNHYLKQDKKKMQEKKDKFKI